MLAFHSKINQLLNCTWISPKWFVLIFLFNIDLWQPTKSFVIMRMKLQILLQEVWQLPYCLISGVFTLQKSFKWMIIERQEQTKHTNLSASLLLFFSSEIAFTPITLIFTDHLVFYYISLNRCGKTETSRIQIQTSILYLGCYRTFHLFS